MKIEWLILADGAQVVGNKLYVLGGGWDLLTVNSTFPVVQQMALAISFLVAWDETNMKHNFEVEIQHEDGPQLAKMAGQFEVGRPPGLPIGSNQRSQLAVSLPLQIQKPGVHVIITRIEGEQADRTTFRVMDGKALALPKL